MRAQPSFFRRGLDSLRDNVRAIERSRRAARQASEERARVEQILEEVGPQRWAAVEHYLEGRVRTANAHFGADYVILENPDPHTFVLKLSHVSSNRVALKISSDYRVLSWEASGKRKNELRLTSTGGAGAEYEGQPGDYFLPSDVAVYVVQELLQS